MLTYGVFLNAVIKDGYFGDTSRMFIVGERSIKAKKLVNFTYDAMMQAIEVIKPGVPFSEIGRIISSLAKQQIAFSTEKPDFDISSCNKFFRVWVEKQ